MTGRLDFSEGKPASALLFPESGTVENQQGTGPQKQRTVVNNFFSVSSRHFLALSTLFAESFATLGASNGLFELENVGVREIFCIKPIKFTVPEERTAVRRQFQLPTRFL